MIVLDTDHIVSLKHSDSDAFRNLAKRMADSQDQDFVTTAITFEEQLRGWLAHGADEHGTTALGDRASGGLASISPEPLVLAGC